MKAKLVLMGKFAAAASVAAAACVAWTVNAQPLERQMAAMAPPPARANPFAGNTAAAEEGGRIYNQVCTACHGLNGTDGAFAPGLATPGRIYAVRSDQQIFNTIKNGVPGTPMPAHPDLPDDQIWKITAYIYALRGTAIDAPHPGDAAAGKIVFEGKGQCLTCHIVSGRGSVVGPDLTRIANQRKTINIMDSLTKENSRIYPPGGYQSYRLTPLDTYPVVNIVTNDGRKIRGVLRNEDSFSLQMIGLDQKVYLLKRPQIRSIDYETKRLMPSDYDKRLTEKEYNDLLAYVTRLGKPASQTVAAAGGGGGSVD